MFFKDYVRNSCVRVQASVGNDVACICVREWRVLEREREREKRRHPEARDADKATERKLEKNQKTFPGVIKIWFI